MAFDYADYRNQIGRLIDLNSSHWVSNGSTQGAMFVLSEFIRRASHEVIVFSNSIHADVFGSEAFLRAVEGAIRRGVIIDVLLQNEPDVNNGFYKLLKERMVEHNNVSLQVADNSHIVIRAVRFNYCVVDRKSVRYEPDSSMVIAAASMHNPNVAEALSDHYLRIKASFD